MTTTGSIIASAGFWGGGYPDVSFSLVPTGYGCTGSGSNGSGNASVTAVSGSSGGSSSDSRNPYPCTAIDSCGGQRTGPLCGNCGPGFVEGVGSTGCVALTACGTDQAVVWPLAAVAVFVAAAVQLTFVSNVWFPTKTVPKGKVKLTIYFFQVRCAG